MNSKDCVTIMCVGWHEAFPELSGDHGYFHWVGTGREALEMLRVLKTDLLLTSLDLPDLTTWELISRVRALWPEQRWVLVCGRLTDDEEIQARALGVLRIFHTTPEVRELTDLAVAARAQQEKVLVGRHKRQVPARAGAAVGRQFTGKQAS